LYYSDFRTQAEVRRRAGAILSESAGLKLASCVDFGGLLPGSMFGGEVVFSDAGPPTLSPTISSPDEAPRLAARVDAMSIEEAGLIPRLFEWRRQLRLERSGKPQYVLRLPGLVTLSQQVCGAENLRDWLKSRPGKIMDLAGMLRRTLIRLAHFIRQSISAPFLIIDDPAMGEVAPEVFHEVFWRATRSVVLSLTMGTYFRCIRASVSNDVHLEYIARLRPRVAQVGDSVAIETIRSRFDNMALWGHFSPSLLRNGAPDEIKAAARACIEKARSLGMPLLLSPSGRVEPGTPVENIAALTAITMEK